MRSFPGPPVFAAGLMLLLRGPLMAQPCSMPLAADRLNAISYLRTLDSILGIDAAAAVQPPAPPSGPLRDSLRREAARYRDQFEQVDGITPPTAFEAIHAQLAKALAAQAAMNEAAANVAPAGEVANEETINQWAHAVPGVGYARDDQSRLQCELKGLADELDVTYRVLGVCSAVDDRIEGATAGSKSAPVSEVYMLHETIPPAPGEPFGRPNVRGFAISTIYVKAGQPLTIAFDNRNPAPFVFNIAVYRGESARVRANEIVAQTGAYAGVRVHTLHFNQPGSNFLSPGTYSYVDNVHPGAMRGKLIVVP